VYSVLQVGVEEVRIDPDMLVRLVVCQQAMSSVADVVADVIVDAVDVPIAGKIVVLSADA
jgi:hypothetical protein